MKGFFTLSLYHEVTAFGTNTPVTNEHLIRVEGIPVASLFVVLPSGETWPGLERKQTPDVNYGSLRSAGMPGKLWKG